jgi:hypothetical protein
VAGGFRRRCYDRRRHSERHLGGPREHALRRDGGCQLCLAQTRLAVRHRRPGCNRPALRITLCLGCHVRVHRRRQLPGFYSDLFFGLWREAHPATPAQLRLPFAA